MFQRHLIDNNTVIKYYKIKQFSGCFFNACLSLYRGRCAPDTLSYDIPLGEYMKKTLFAILCGLVLLTAGCFGPFKLTKRVYDWNSSLENKWGRESLFLVMNVIPVYGFVMLADAVVFNAIDFWNEDGLDTASLQNSAKIVSVGDKQAVMSFSAQDKKLRIDLFQNYRPSEYVVIESLDDCTVARDKEGAIVMAARTLADGTVCVHDRDGVEIKRYSAEEEKGGR